jgi:hypothetical protein
MWKKPWSMKEGFAIGGGLIVVGLLLDFATGPVVWDAFAWPLNALVLGVFLFAIAICIGVRRNNYPLHFLSTHRAAIPALIYAVVLTIVMGATRQTVNGRWFNDMLTFWPFVLIYAYIAFLLGYNTLRRLEHMVNFRKRHRHATHRPWRRDLAFLLNHAGLFIALVCATLGNADMQRLRMITVVGQSEWRAMNDRQQVIELPLAIELKKFILEEYDDGSPRRFASDIVIQKPDGKNYAVTVDVNHPAEVDGWKIYQYGYDTAAGAMSQTSILELIRDPWLPAVYSGIFMMLAGAIFLFFTRSRAPQGVSEEKVRKQREAERRKRYKEASKRRKEEEFFSGGKVEQQHHSHSDSADDTSGSDDTVSSDDSDGSHHHHHHHHHSHYHVEH